MEKIINSLINNWTKGVETYTHNGSTWLIFTDSKKWVIELTDSKTLWYNYNFFKQIFEFTSLDVVENQQYITKWVEDNIINKELTYATLFRDARDRKQQFEDALENGVRHTEIGWHQCNNIDDAIEKGVKETNSTLRRTLLGVDDIIQNGVKETSHNATMFQSIYAEDAIQNGVRDTQSNPYENESWIKGVIKKGVRHTLNTEYMPTSMVEDIIQSGVKETNPVDVMKFFDNKMEDALQNGVKETNYDTDNYTDDVNEVIREGVSTSHPRQYVGGDIVDKVIDKGIIETHDDVYHHKGRIDGVIKNGIKETKTPGKDGDILSTIEWMEENKSTSYTKMIDDVIDNGEKINGTYAGGQRQSEKCKSVVEYGKQI